MPLQTVDTPTQSKYDKYKSLPEDLRETLDHLVVCSTIPKVALLLRSSQAESAAARAGSDNRLDELAMHGAEVICRDVLRDLESILRDACIANYGFAVLSDER
jgi:hypothetical protein